MKTKISNSLFRVFFVIFMLLALVAPAQSPAYAATLTIEPLTWNMIGLDSNNVNVGPNHFPIGARVCSDGATTATVTFDFADGDLGPGNFDGDTYINLREGTNEVVTLTFSGSGCQDAYFEAEVTRSSSAYNKTRDYVITATDDGGATIVSTPSNRELFVEYLISQSRNSVTNMQLSSDGTSYTDVAAGGTMTLMVGSTYWIKLYASTATNGYEQLETFINFPNTIFQVESVNTTYTADTTTRVDGTGHDQLYADGCYWINNTTDDNYRSCLDTGKAGGEIVVTYQIKILKVPDAPLVNPEPLQTLVYDFSGSSFHYNADFSSSVRFAKIVNASIEKSFTPKTLNPNTTPRGTSTLTFTVNNPGPAQINNFNFVDNLPTNGGTGQMSIASTVIIYSNCGSPSPATGTLSIGQTALSFSNITVAGFSSCTIAVTVTTTETGTYNNDSNNLYIGTDDTGDDAKDTLVASDKPAGPSACVGSETTLAEWTMPTTGQGSGGPPPPYSYIRSISPGVVNTALARAHLSGTANTPPTPPYQSLTTGVTTNAWSITDAFSNVSANPIASLNTLPYFEFEVDTSNYGGVRINFQYHLYPEGNWAANNNNTIYIYSSTDGTNFVNAGSVSATKGSWQPLATATAATTGVSKTWFRITAVTRGNKASATMDIDNIEIDGCLRPEYPTLSKAFSPVSIATNSQYSTLTFSVANPNAIQLTGVAFTDTLPTGLEIDNPNGLATTCLFGTAPITAAVGTQLISLGGATLNGSESCTISVRVKGTVAKDYKNVSGNITSTQTGPNTTSTGYGTSNLRVVDPPVISKSFGASYILSGGTTRLTFNITNPNGHASLSSVSFTDTFPTTPGAMTVASPLTTTNACGGSLLDNTGGALTAGDAGIRLTGVTLSPGASCTVSVNVTASTTGTYDNTTGNVSHVINTSTVNGNTANAKLNVRAQVASIKLTKQVGLTNNVGGAWYSYLNVQIGTSVYYRFTVENTGDVDFTSFSITDSTLAGWLGLSPVTDPIPCTWYISNPALSPPAAPYVLLSGSTLPAASNGDPIAYCVVGSVTAASGTNTNTATVTGTSTLGSRTDTDSATYVGGAVTTPVTLSYFQAEQRGANVQFDWSTLTETGNVGFNIYVESDGHKVPLNDELILSAAVDSLERQDYTFQAKVKGDTFYIEDVSIWGETRIHGPFQAGERYGQRLEEELVDQSAISQEAAQNATARQAELRKDMKVPAAARQEPVNGGWKAQLTSTINLKVNQTGIQHVTYEMLRDAGLDLKGVPAAKITVLNRGQMVPVYVEARGKFGPGSYIEFYGEALDTLYTDTNIYTVQVTQSNTDRVQVSNNSIKKNVTPVASYMETLKVNNQREYSPSAPGVDPWFDKWMIVYQSPSSWDFPFEVDSLANTSSAHLSVNLWGMIDLPAETDHHVAISVNGSDLSDIYFGGIREQEISADIPVGVLKEGTNTLKVTVMGDTGTPYDMVFMDKFDVTYPRTFQAKDGRLTFTAAGDAFAVRNLPNKDVVVYRLDANGPVRLNQVRVQAAGGGTYTASFAGLEEARTYLVTTADASFQPGTEAVRVPNGLDRPAEFLIISHPNFIEGLEPLVTARRAEGLTVSVVNVEDLYTQYSYGIFDPQAIKDYINYASNNLDTRYVLLVGGDTRDYRNYTGAGSLSFVPSLYAWTSRDATFVPADPLFTDLDGDNLPNLAIGRFPVRTQAELAMIVQKTLTYQNKNYGRTALFVTDKEDPIVSFKGVSSNMEQSMPSGWDVQGVHLDDVSVLVARLQLLDAMNKGTALVTFTGHSGPTSWTFDDLFSTAHASQLYNTGRPFVAVQWGCWNTYYVNPTRLNLAQSLLFSGDNGAAAVLGSVTLAEAGSELMLGNLLTPRMTQADVRIGDALQESKVELAKTNPDLLDVLLGWNLMGDPTLMIDP